MMKRAVFVYLFVAIILSSFVSAQAVNSAQDFINDVADVLEPVAKWVVGPLDPTASFDSSQLLFAKFLLLILIFAIVWVALSQVEILRSNNFILIIVSAVVSLLATRWLGDTSLVQAILLPYSTLGIALSVAVPFLVWFFIVNLAVGQDKPAIFRRLAWALFGIIFFVLLIARWSQISAVGIWIYALTLGAAILMASLDGTIQKFMASYSAEKVINEAAWEEVKSLRRKLKQLESDLAGGVIDARKYGRDKKRYMDRLKELSGS